MDDAAALYGAARNDAWARPLWDGALGRSGCVHFRLALGSGLRGDFRARTYDDIVCIYC